MQHASLPNVPRGVGAESVNKPPKITPAASPSITTEPIIRPTGSGLRPKVLDITGAAQIVAATSAVPTVMIPRTKGKTEKPRVCTFSTRSLHGKAEKPLISAPNGRRRSSRPIPLAAFSIRTLTRNQMN
jgi:hypothetical protein